MILNGSQIRQICKEEHPDRRKNIEYEQRLDMIVNGTKHVDYLIKISQLDNKLKKELRERYSKTTRWLASNVIRPFNNIFTAVGGSKDLIFEGSTTKQKKSKNEFIKLVKNSPDGGDMSYFMSNIWGKKVIDSPRSLILTEKTEDGKHIYPAFISSFYIYNWKYKGQLNFDYVVITEGNYYIDGKPCEVLRVMDDEKDYTVIKQDDIITIVDDKVTLKDNNENSKEFKTINNTFGSVPALQMTTKINSDLVNKDSILHDVVELFEEHLLDDSIKRIFKFLHGFPYFSEFDNKTCPACNGDGKNGVGETCPVCGGTGIKKKDVSDVNLIDIPDNREEVLITPRDWAAYISPSIETWRQMNEDLENNANKTFYAVWGTELINEKNKSYSTLGARILDAKPINDVLEVYSQIGQKIETELTNIQGNFYKGSDFKDSIILYGNFYLTNTPDQILAKYEELLKINANYNDLDKTISDYYNTVFAKNPRQLNIALNDLELEPYRHDTIEKVQTFNISETIKKRKSYYQLFRKSISDSEFLVLAQTKKLFYSELDKFINEVHKEPQNTNKDGNE